jgi:hypothetical protein
MDPNPARIVIELDAAGSPIRGSVRAEGHLVRPFTGWTGLFAALRAAVGEDPHKSDGPAGGTAPITGLDREESR